MWRPCRSVRMHLDEVDEVLAAMRRLAPVEADTGEWSGEISNASELEAAGTHTLTSLALKAETEHREIVATLASDPPTYNSPYGKQPVGIVRVPDDDYELIGIANAIETVFRRQQTFIGGLRELAVVDLLIPLVSALFFLYPLTLTLNGALFGRDADWGDFAKTSILLMTAFLIILVAVARLRCNPRPGGTVLLVYKQDAPSFWTQYRSAILLSLATNSFVAAIFYLLGRWQG